MGQKSTNTRVYEELVSIIQKKSDLYSEIKATANSDKIDPTKLRELSDQLNIVENKLEVLNELFDGEEPTFERYTKPSLN